MKILVLNIAKPKEAAPVFSYGMALGLVQNNCEVYALMQDNTPNKSQWNELLDERHLYYTHINNEEESHVKQLLDFIFIESKKIKKFFKGIKFDIVLSPMFANWSTFLLPLFKAKEKVAVCHDPLPHSGEKKINVILAKRFYKKNDRLIVLTKRFRKPASVRYNKPLDKIVAIPHGRMNSYLSIQNNEKRQNYNKHNINFLFFGRIERYKGLGVLGEAYKILYKKAKNISLTIAGNGDFSEFNDLYKGLPNTNLLIRYIDDDEVGGLFDGPNVVAVVPYIDATQSGIISIALEYGVPIIASNTGGLKEQLDDGKIGILFEAGNVEELARAMKCFVDSPDLFEKQRKIEKEYLKFLDWDKVTKIMLDSIDI